MIHYIVVSDSYIVQFEHKVSEKRNEGWTCVGGVCVLPATTDEYEIWSQAMERRDLEEQP